MNVVRTLVAGLFWAVCAVPLWIAFAVLVALYKASFWLELAAGRFGARVVYPGMERLADYEENVVATAERIRRPDER